MDRRLTGEQTDSSVTEDKEKTSVLRLVQRFFKSAATFDAYINK